YTFYVQDDNGCQITPLTFDVPVGVDIQPSVDVIDNCTNNIPGNVVVVNANPALLPDLQYSIDGVTYGASNIFTDLAPNTYTAYVQHTNGCIQTADFTINALQPVSASASVTQDVLCHGEATGSIEVTATGGTGTLQYAISPNFVYGTANTFNNLPAGTYTIMVMDTIGCEVTITDVTVSEPATALTASLNGIGETCLAANDGEVTLTISGGTPPYYTGTDGVTFNQDQFVYNGLVGGQTYTFYVQDDNGCQITPLTFNVPVGVDIQPSVDIVENCSSNVPGNIVTIEANPALAGDLQYSIDGVTYGASNIFTDLAPNTYTAYVQHTNGCIQTADFTINALQPVSASATVTQDVLCHGEATGSIEIIATGGTGTLYYTVSPMAGQLDGNTFINLPANTYTVTVTDDLGCQVIITDLIITEPSEALSALISATPETCINVEDGQIDITVTGGTAPYSTSLDGASFIQDQFTYTGIAAGSHTIDVIDANGCQVAQQSIIIISGVDSEPTVQIVNNCSNNVPGNIVTIEINPALIGQVQYSLDGVTYSSVNDFVDLAPGNYTAYVQHTNGCIQTVDFTINTLQPISASVIVTQDVLCYEGTDGSLEITASGGTGTLYYSISPSAGQLVGNTYINLPASTYTVTVTDDLGCSLVINNLVVNEPSQPLTAMVSVSNETCLNAVDGQIDISVNGGTAPYSTSLNGAPFVQDQFTYSGLASGSHTIDVVDANGCQVAQQTVIVAPGANVQPSVEVIYNCTANTPGNIVTINVNQALVGQVQYSLDGVNYSSVNDFTDLTPGNYTAYVLHSAYGCNATVDFTVNDVQPISASANVISDIDCYGDSNGSIEVSASGGDGSYLYAISPNFVYGNSNIFNNLTAGTYSIKVMDGLGCELTLNNVIINGPTEAISATIDGTGETCLGNDNGTATINISGGTPPYYTSSNGGVNWTPVNGTTVTYDNLLGDWTYTFYVMDQNGCQIAAPLTHYVENGVDIRAGVSVQISCNDNVAGNVVTISVSDDVIDEVQYSLDGITFTDSNVFTDLEPGNYVAYVLHINGCLESVAFTVTETPEIYVNASTTDILCYGDNTGSITVYAGGGNNTFLYGISPDYVMSNSNVFENLPAGDYTIKVEDAISGCYNDELTITINQPDEIVATFTTLDETCEGENDGAIIIENVTGGTPPYYMGIDNPNNYTLEQYVFEGLATGSHTIYIKDSNGCVVESIDININSAVAINASSTVMYDCITGNSTVNIIVNSSVIGQVSYYLNGEEYPAPPYYDLAVGDYDVQVIHDDGCIDDDADFTITEFEPVSVTLQESDMNQVTAIATGGTGQYTYEFNGEDYGTNNVYNYYQSQVITVVVYDGTDCPAQAQIEVQFVDIQIPPVFTPDDDTNNDTWSPINTHNYPKITTKIFDRYGRVVAILRVGQAWDGTYNGKHLPSGDYWYVIELGSPESNREYVGHFTLYR
ncbi:T9SS type B sorting domain-containing protein, partial [Mangrovimonas aestuarii]|uniref:T9SS type B sorting domain-containing protein n=1 Tax=Mangrovimonas aestuarii TaxID=3018443 RepID=UPI002378F7AB